MLYIVDDNSNMVLLLGNLQIARVALLSTTAVATRFARFGFGSEYHTSPLHFTGLVPWSSESVYRLELSQGWIFLGELVKRWSILIVSKRSLIQKGYAGTSLQTWGRIRKTETA